jgi:hypothetical protein
MIFLPPDGAPISAEAYLNSPCLSGSSCHCHTQPEFSRAFTCVAVSGLFIPGQLRFDEGRAHCYDRTAGWSSLVARWAHNPKVGGSNPPPATKIILKINKLKGSREIGSLFHCPCSLAKCPRSLLNPRGHVHNFRFFDCALEIVLGAPHGLSLIGFVDDVVARKHRMGFVTAQGHGHFL